MKKIVALVAVLFSVVVPVQASANTPAPTVVVVDYLFDSKSPEYSSKVVTETCFVSPCTAPTADQIYKSTKADALHGTLMATVVAKTNPNANIILARIGKINSKGMLEAITPTQFNGIMVNVLSWVSANAKTYNIVAVSSSMSAIPNKQGTSCSTSVLSDPIAKLKASAPSVAVMFSAGNTGNTSAVGYPACLSGVVAVGATNTSETRSTGTVNPISLSSAAVGKVDFYALGTWSLPQRLINGQTSPATAALAAYWAKNYNGTYQSTYDLLKSKATLASNQNTSSNTFVNVLG